MKLMKFAGLALLLVMSTAELAAEESAALPDDVLELRRMASRAHAEGDREAFRSIVAKMHELRPNNSEYMYQLVLAHSMLSEYPQAFDMMLRMQRQGLSYDFDQSLESIPLRDKEIYEYLNDLMVKAGEPIGNVTEVARLDSDLGRVEAIDWDPGRQAFLVGTITGGRVLAVSEDGSFNELLRADRENGLWGIQDLVVDAERNRLWLASSATPAFSGFDPVDKGRSALFEFALDTLELQKRYPVPVDGLPHVLGKMTLASTGDLYFADRSLPIIYSLKSGGDRLQPLYATRNLISLRGIAVSDDGQSLYFSDYELGVIRLDLSNGQVATVGRPETLNVGGIEGLEYQDGSLVIIQNGIRPQRIMRLELNDDGTAVENVVPIAVALEVFDYPSYGTLVDDKLVFFANSGASGSDQRREAIRLVRTGVEGIGELVAPDMKRYLEQQEDREQRPGTEQGESADSEGLNE